MKKILIFPVILALGFMSFTGCEKEEVTSQKFQAKLLASFCGFHIVQIRDSAFYKYGMNWTNSQGIAYEHVFAVKNHCSFVKAKVKPGEIFNCVVIENAKPINCVVCSGFMETPPLTHDIKVIKK